VHSEPVMDDLVTIAKVIKPRGIKGEVANAWVVVRHGHTVTEEELRAYCRERLAPYKVPARVAFRKELPKTTVGKVLRRALAETT